MLLVVIVSLGTNKVNNGVKFCSKFAIVVVGVIGFVVINGSDRLAVANLVS